MKFSLTSAVCVFVALALAGCQIIPAPKSAPAALASAGVPTQSLVNAPILVTPLAPLLTVAVADRVADQSDPAPKGGDPAKTAAAATTLVPEKSDPANALQTQSSPVRPASKTPQVAPPADPAAATPEQEPEQEPEPQFVSPQQQACLKKGAIWGEAGLPGMMACITRTKDAGKSCKSGKDCQGYCLARSGTCAPFTPLFGCNDVVQDNGAEVTLCLN